MMCSDNDFAIIVWDFINIARKLQKLKLFFTIYPNENSVTFLSHEFRKIGGGVTPIDSIIDRDTKKSKMMHVLSLFRL